MSTTEWPAGRRPGWGVGVESATGPDRGVLPLSVGDEDPQALADREVIGRAEGILMKRGGLDEEGACRRLRKLARDHNQKSQMILRAGEAFQPPAP